VGNGDVVVLVGRRRRASYAKVQIGPKKQKKSSCVVPANLAANLRLRQDDAVKVVPLHSVDHDETRSGDLVLLRSASVPAVASVTFSPVEDSLDALQGGEGGDEIPDEELMDRFIKPYTENNDGATVKSNAVLTLVDENGKKLDFVVSQVELDNISAATGEGKEKDEEQKEGEEGACF